SMSVSRYSYSYDDDGMPFSWKSPETYLAETALKKNNRALLEETAAELEKQERTAEAKSLKAQADLYFCPESEFEGKARTQLLSVKPEERTLSDQQIVQIWQKRKLPPVLSAMLLERLNKPETRRSGYVSSYVPIEYLTGLVEAGHRAEAEKLIKATCAAALGPEDKRAEFLKQNWNPRGYSPAGTPGYLIRNLRQGMIQYMQKDELAFMAMEVLNDQLFRFSEEVRRDDYYGDFIRLENSAVIRDWPPTQKPERVKSILASSPFLADLPDWRPVTNPANKDVTVLPLLLNGYVRAGAAPGVRKTGTALLKEYPATLGRDILIAAASAEKVENMRRGVLDLLASRRADLEKLPAERLLEVAAFAREIVGTSDAAKLKLSPEATAVLEWLKPKVTKTDTLAVFLKPAEKWDKPVNASSWSQKVRDALKAAAKESPEKFQAVVARARNMRVQGIPGPNSSQQKQDNSIFAIALGTHIKDMATERKDINAPGYWSAFVNVAATALDPVNDLDWDSNSIETEAKGAFTKLWVECLKDRAKRDALTEFVSRLAKVFTEDQLRLYTRPLLSALRQQSSQSKDKEKDKDKEKESLTPEELTAWVASPAAQASPLAKQCALLFSIEAARSAPDKAAPAPAVVTAYNEQVLNVAKNEKLAAKVRLSMTAEWLNHAYKFLPPEVCKEAAGMLAAAWQARQAYEIRDAESIFRAVLALPDAALRVELLKPMLAATSRVTVVRLGITMDEELVVAAAQCGDKALMERVAGSRNGRVHHGFLAAMLNEGLFEDARRWFEQNALSIGTKITLDFAAWSKNVEEKGAEFVKTLDAPHKAYLAEILLAMLPATDDTKARTEQIRARLIPLAKKFGSVIFPDDAWRDKIIEHLSSDDQVISEAAGFFGPLAEKEPLSALARLTSAAPRAKLRVLHLWVMHEFKQRRFGPLEQFLSEMSIRRSTNYYYSNSDDDPWTKALRDTLKQTLLESFLHSHEWSAAEREKMGAIYRTALEGKTFISDAPDSEDVLQCALLYHAFTGQNAAMQVWWKALPEDQQKKTRERFETYAVDIWPAKEDLAKRYGEDRKAQLAFVKEYLANPVGVVGGDNSLERPVTLVWATRPEILEMSDELLSREPRGSNTGRQLAVLAEKERAWEKGAAVLAFAAEHLDKESLKDQPRLLLQRALMLLEAGKPQDALAETERLRPMVIEPFKGGKVEVEALTGLAKWIEARGRALLAVGRNADALAFLGINPSVQKLAMREAGGLLSEASMHESVFRYVEAKTGIKVINLIPKESTWRYRDSAEAPPASWYATDFDDKEWPSGQGRLGYGDPVKTTLSYGSDEKQKPMACYFRTTFEVADLKAINSVHMGIQRDDGCIVYLNGKEIVRQNMPEGAVDHTTDTGLAVDKDAENEYFPAMITPDHLVSGKNVIAVEVHQVKATSTDLTFDLQMRGNLPDPTEIMRTLDPAEIGPKLGDLWTALPEAVRKALE
ncbi:MAG TPA: hypothetical protein VG796_02120, partial [Verrucomicrobiales bacterium]|nr:hypothetical protein [Verrucomicrobiales bacterium]